MHWCWKNCHFRLLFLYVFDLKIQQCFCYCLTNTVCTILYPLSSELSRKVFLEATLNLFCFNLIAVISWLKPLDSSKADLFIVTVLKQDKWQILEFYIDSYIVLRILNRLC